MPARAEPTSWGDRFATRARTLPRLRVTWPSYRRRGVTGTSRMNLDRSLMVDFTPTSLHPYVSPFDTAFVDVTLASRSHARSI